MRHAPLNRLHARNKGATENRWTTPHSKSNRCHQLNLNRLFVVLYTVFTRRLLNKINFLRGRIMATDEIFIYWKCVALSVLCLPTKVGAYERNTQNESFRSAQCREMKSFAPDYQMLVEMGRQHLQHHQVMKLSQWFNVQFHYHLPYFVASMQVEAEANLSRCKSKS